MIEGARKAEKFKIVSIALTHGPSAFWAISKSGEVLFSGTEVD